jgi:hypothetical protein
VKRRLQDESLCCLSTPASRSCSFEIDVCRKISQNFSPADATLADAAIDNEDTFAISVLERIRPMIETLPLEQAADAYARMMQGKARFRMVLVTG